MLGELSGAGPLIIFMLLTFFACLSCLSHHHLNSALRTMPALTTGVEEGEGAFQLVRSKRRSNTKPHTSANKSYSNSNGDLTGPSTGFTYASTSSKSSKSGPVATNSEREDRAFRAVESFVRYLGSQLRSVKGKQREGEGEGKLTYAQQIADCLHHVWSNVESTSDGGPAVSEAREQARKPPVPRRIVCLGLGSPITSRSAQIQLALMVVLRSYLLLLHDEPAVLDAFPESKTLNKETEADSTAAAEDTPADSKRSDQGTAADSTTVTEDAFRDSESSDKSEAVSTAFTKGNAIECVAYDPVFTPSDVALLARWAVRSFTSSTSPSTDGTDNTPASKADEEEETIESLYTNITTPTLLYMPHCDRELYERVLSLNYTSPPDDSRPVVLLSNILSNYTTYTTSLDQVFPRLASLIPRFEVRELPNWEAGKKSAPLRSEDEEDEEVVKAAVEFAKLWDRNALRDLGFHWV